jgi:ferritin-like protein
MSSEQLHEAADALRVETIDHHRAVTSLVEELEAVDWYDQRVDATTDEELKAILRHNRDEEKEHAAMVLEWIRRRDPQLDVQLRKYLFTAAPITDRAEEADAPIRAPATTSLGIGSLRDKELL